MMLRTPGKTKLTPKNHYWLIAHAGLLVLYSTTTFAGSMEASTPYGLSNLSITGYLGGTTTLLNPDDLLFPLATDRLISNNKYVSDLTGGGGIAYHFDPKIIMPSNTIFHDISFGVDVLYFSTSQLGHVWQYEQPQFNNFSYDFSVESTRGLIDTEWTFNPIYKNSYPFVEAGVGFSYNNTSFFETPLASDVGNGISLGRNGQYNLAYTVGAGMKFPVYDNLSLSMRYLYANLGHANTSAPSSSGLTSPISAYFYTQTWVAGLTYLLQ